MYKYEGSEGTFKKVKNKTGWRLLLVCTKPTPLSKLQLERAPTLHQRLKNVRCAWWLTLLQHFYICHALNRASAESQI